MLFVFESGKASSFWMKGMRFALDFVWISSGCRRGHHRRTSAGPDQDTPTYSSPAPAAYTAGELAAPHRCDTVRFSSVPQPEAYGRYSDQAIRPIGIPPAPTQDSLWSQWACLVPALRTAPARRLRRSYTGQPPTIFHADAQCRRPGHHGDPFRDGGLADRAGC